GAQKHGPVDGGEREGVSGRPRGTHAGAAGAQRLRRTQEGRRDRGRARFVRDLEPRALDRSSPDAARQLRRHDAQAVGAKAVSAEPDRHEPLHEPPALHAPVLVDEVLRWLTPVPPGTWIVDGTVGMGGHAAALMSRAEESRLLGLDRDADTLARA